MKKSKVMQVGINTFKWASRHHTFLPRTVKVETTKVCNLKCVGCRRNFGETLAKAEGPKHLTVEKLWRIVATTPMEVVRFEGDGEPTCNPHFRDLVRFCCDNGIRSAMTCNGTLLDEEYIRFLKSNGMRRIHISFDGATKGTFEKQRVGASYDAVLHNCELISKSGIQLFMNIVPSTKELIDELPEYVRLASATGATGILIIKFQADKDFGTPIDWKGYNGALEEVKALAEEKKLLFIGTGETGPTFHECEDPYICPYVTLTDDVYACAYMANMRTTEVYAGEVLQCPSQNYVMGNLNDDWMRSVWENDAYRELRAFLKRTHKARGTTAEKEDLLYLKKLTGSVERFAYCAGCLCRWGETGL